VRTFLFYVFFEIMKNSARASLECSMDLEDKGSSNYRPIPPIHITVPEQVSPVGKEFGNPAVLKLADEGLGMSRLVLQKAWSYFFSSVKDRPGMSSEVNDFSKGSPLAGFGFGLPMCRIMARYFSGDLDMNSIPGHGTEVYIYL
jgi:pyruvate dehydrogenase kinase 2/3/4